MLIFGFVSTLLWTGISYAIGNAAMSYGTDTALAWLLGMLLGSFAMVPVFGLFSFLLNLFSPVGLEPVLVADLVQERKLG